MTCVNNLLTVEQVKSLTIDGLGDMHGEIDGHGLGSRTYISYVRMLEPLAYISFPQTFAPSHRAQVLI